jgi:hypothetical protein
MEATVIPKPEDMTAADVIRIAEHRGFRVFLEEEDPPKPVLSGPTARVTPPLLEALKAFREEIIALIRSRPTTKEK